MQFLPVGVSSLFGRGSIEIDLKYLGKSRVEVRKGGALLRYAPNLGREPVAFDGELVDPLAYREAMSALHAVVVADLRFQRKDRAPHEAWKKAQADEEAEVRRIASARHATPPDVGPLPKELDVAFQDARRRYWDARAKWQSEMWREDPALVRMLVPCDPVVTVAPDAVLYEAFAKDESAYGCLVVDRERFRGAQSAQLGTTNVDYSPALFAEMQALRTYKSTRIVVDPEGFGVQTAGRADLREEKIVLPPSWLRGFAQIGASSALPATRLVVDRTALYSILALLRRRREKQGPRALRFELAPGQEPVVVVEPWDVRIPLPGARCDEARARTVKVWGRRRLHALERLLPIAERFDVALLGSGLPSIWTAHLPGMRFALALSGWTTNDWTSGAGLDLLATSGTPDALTVEAVARELKRVRTATFAALSSSTGARRDALLPALLHEAKLGQVVHDAATDVWRWREVMPPSMGQALLDDEPKEANEGRRIFVERAVVVTSAAAMSPGRRLVTGQSGRFELELLLDADDVVLKGRCACDHHRSYGIKRGPCRHLLALRLQASAA